MIPRLEYPIDKLRSKAAKQADELRRAQRTIEALQNDKALLLSDLNIERARNKQLREERITS